MWIHIWQFRLLSSNKGNRIKKMFFTHFGLLLAILFVSKKHFFCLNMLLFPVNILYGTKDSAERDGDVLYGGNSKHILCLQFI